TPLYHRRKERKLRKSLLPLDVEPKPEQRRHNPLLIWVLRSSYDSLSRHHGSPLWRFGQDQACDHLQSVPLRAAGFPNYFSKGIPNVWRRFTSSVFKVAPPMICMYLTYTWGNHVHSEGKRKVAADYEKEE
uniref:Cytochrome b-c1 complex subunit 8 n=1 Tax=Oncorhynchus kisutch TaxID=8019 RepID=A0A8C7GFB1_ONCKI